MQMKQSLLIEHLYGKNGEKIDQAILDSIYRENYMYFQTIVINNLYRVVEKEVDGKKVTTVEELSADEKNENSKKEQISDAIPTAIPRLGDTRMFGKEVGSRTGSVVVLS